MRTAEHANQTPASGSSHPPVVAATDLARRFGRVRALGPLTFSLEAGRTVGVLGLNGAGKTTLLRILAGDLRPTSGVARVVGADLAADSFEAKARIGYLPERPPLHDDMDVRSFLRFVGRVNAVVRADLGKGVQSAIERAGIEEVEGRLIGQLSHGYRQRVGIAQAIVHGPELLILDEPTNGLDPVQIVEMRELIGRLAAECTIILSSHVLAEVSKTCDRVIVIHKGRIAADRGAMEFGAAGSELERLLVELVAE